MDQSDSCPDVESCETDGRMKVDFMNFVLNITNQATQPNLNPNDHQGFCAIDLQPLFDNSASYRQQRDNWATAEFVKGFVSNQRAITLTSLQEYVQLASEQGSGGGDNPADDHSAPLTWSIIFNYGSITNFTDFKLKLQKDFANALEIPLGRVVIDGVDKKDTNSITINLHIVPTANPDSEPTALALRDRLESQWADPNSPIYQGELTSNTDSSPSGAPDTNPSGSTSSTGGYGGAYSVAPSMIIGMLVAFLTVFFFSK